MNFRPRPQDTEPEINLTPLIDVVFLLLIFFMVTTTFSKEAEIQLELPEATSSDKPNPERNLLTVLIDEHGRYAVQGPLDESPRELINATSDTLQRTLKQAARTMADPVVLIRADRLTPHEDVIRAMDAARAQGFLKMTFSIEHVSG